MSYDDRRPLTSIQRAIPKRNARYRMLMKKKHNEKRRRDDQSCMWPWLHFLTNFTPTGLTSMPRNRIICLASRKRAVSPASAGKPGIAWRNNILALASSNNVSLRGGCNFADDARAMVESSRERRRRWSFGVATDFLSLSCEYDSK